MRTKSLALVMNMCLLSTSLILAGCASGFDMQGGPVQVAIPHLKGKVLGGRNPVVGSAVYLYAAGTTGYGSPSTSLLGAQTTCITALSCNPAYPTLQDSNGSGGAGNWYVATLADGSWSVSGDYTCTTGQQIYAYALGGQTGTNTSSNPNASFIAVLGECSTLANITGNIIINEVSTVAAAYALAQFSSSANVTSGGVNYTPSTSIGAPSSTTNSALATLEATNLSNAFATAGNLYNITDNTGSGLTVTAGGNGTPPYKKINSLGNSLYGCVNTTGATGSTTGGNSCDNLFSYVGDGATNTTSSPITDTASAAFYIAKHPGANAQNIYNLATGTAPYPTDLTVYPADWTMSIIFTGGGLSTDGTACCGLASHAINVDAYGNIWNVGVSAAPYNLSEFTNLGVPVSSTGYSNTALLGAAGAVLDATSQNVFIPMEENAAGTAAENYVLEYNIAGSTWTTITPVSGTTKELSQPIDVAFDGSGNLWVVNPAASLVKLTPSASAPYTYTYSAKTTSTTYLADYISLAVEPGATGNIWVDGEGSTANKKYAAQFTNADAVTTDGVTDYAYAYTIALDATGNAWVANEEVALSKVPVGGGTATNYTYPTEYTTVEVLDSTMDGAGDTWIADFNNGLLYEYNNSGVLISGTKGYQPNEGSLTTFYPPAKPTAGYVEPAYLTVDGSGDVWFKPYGSATIQEMIGVSVPVVTPLAYAVANSLIGQEP